MRTGDAWPEQKRRDKARETMEVYAPIANRLGILNVKEELEDRSLHYLDPVGYEDISKMPVSYTHLDVYKRQVVGRGTAELGKADLQRGLCGGRHQRDARLVPADRCV